MTERAALKRRKVAYKSGSTASATLLKGPATGRPKQSKRAATPAPRKLGAPKKSLSDQAYELLREQILTLKRAPGSWFREREIAAETGFGAMPLREAIDRLAHEGLVHTVPRRGNQVTPLTAKYVRDYFDVWVPLAISVCRMACARATDEQLLEITRSIETVAALVRGPPTEPAIIAATGAGFQRIIEAADNEHFTMIWRRISAANERIFRTAYEKDPAAATRSIYFHLEALNAWRARDIDKVAQSAEKYMMAARASLLRLL